MKLSRYLIIALTTSTLIGCGGGGSGSGSETRPSSLPDEISEEKELVFEFSGAPLQPKVFNLAAFSDDQRNQFSPGDMISLTWKIDLYYDDLSVPEFNESFPYTASVYLSEDGIFQLEDDLELFTIQCVFPSSGETACGQFASFRCDYAPENRNEIACSSLPAGRTQGIDDLVVDTTRFLDVIPKTADLLIVTCFYDEPAKCDTHQLNLQLN